MAKAKTTGFFKDSNNLWTIDTKIKVDGVFKHFKKSGYSTLSEAKRDFERAKEEFISSKSLNKYKVVLFDDLLVEYEKMRKVIVDESTLGCDRSVFNVYLLPYFSKALIKNVFKPDAISSWFYELVNNPKLTNNKKSKVITRMKDILKFAYTRKYISAEVFQDCDVLIYQVKYSKKPKNERVVWTEEEEKAFLNAIKSNRKHNLMFRLLLISSPRLGEFLALQPKCFDFDKCKMKICQQVKNIYGKGAILTDKLKTNESYRTIVLPKSICEELKMYIDDFNLGKSDYLWFHNSKARPMSRNSIRRQFSSYCKKANIREMNLHALRHNQAVKLASVCSTGEEIEVAARRLGHSPSMFLNTYANHVNDEKETKLLEKMFTA